MATLYPFVSFKSRPTHKVNSGNNLIFGTQFTSIVDSILIINTSNANILVEVTMLKEFEGNPVTIYIEKSLNIPKDSKAEILLGMVIYAESGDLLFAKSNYSSNTFDSLVSYREMSS
jgi:hypothetical protein